MPMSFPDFKSLKHAARVHKFREPNEGESEEEFRSHLANHVSKIDLIESQEIRCGKGWDKWGERDSMDMLIRAMINRQEK